MPEISIRGRRIGYEVQPRDFNKSDLSLVLVHGTAGDREDWRAQLDGLSNIANVFAVELPGHGKSEPPGESDVEAYSGWVMDFIEIVGLQRVVLVGCSLGSAVCQTIALSSPAWLKGLGVVGGGARLKVHPAFLQGIVGDKENALNQFAKYALSEKADESLKKRILDKFFAAPAELLEGDLGACNAFDVMDRLKELNLPTCIVVGEEDRLTPVKYSKFLHRSIEGSTLTVLPATGHLAMLEKPGEFNRVLGDFLARLTETRS
ncbi:alpha/beta fold hydrolase [Thermodesulfobacteriota bacterium]